MNVQPLPVEAAQFHPHPLEMYMKRVRRSLGQILNLFALLGIDLRRSIKSIGALAWYWRDLRTLKAQQKTSLLSFQFGQNLPYLTDRHSEGGTTKGHYFFQDLLIAQRIFANQPELHVDIGSRIDGFVAHVASFRSIEVLDIRPVGGSLPNIKFTRCDLMAELDKSLIDYCDSLSCLHALEHFGLGRYGDPISYDGYIRGFDNLYRILRQGGKFYFSVPIGPQRIEFNAHRVFSMTYLLEMINNKYQIDRFSYVDDQGSLFADVKLTPENIKSSFDCRFGCAIFEMTKR
jgi:hypothetical protein